MSTNTTNSDYSRYFRLRQKVYLVNMSPERDCQIYESLSGVVTSSTNDVLELAILHVGQGIYTVETGKATYKLTTEALGSGIQVLADLIGVVAGNTYQFRIHGTLEMFQRRSIPRVDCSVPIFQLQGNYPLESFRKEWNRALVHMRDNGPLPGLALREASINLSTGGIGCAGGTAKQPTPLSIFFITLDEGLPVCALAETVWEKGVDEEQRFGYRFMNILKADQERINRFISDILRKSGGTHLDFKRDWVLVDKMVADTRKSN